MIQNFNALAIHLITFIFTYIEPIKNIFLILDQTSTVSFDEIKCSNVLNILGLHPIRCLMHKCDNILICISARHGDNSILELMGNFGIAYLKINEIGIVEIEVCYNKN